MSGLAVGGFDPTLVAAMIADGTRETTRNEDPTPLVRTGTVTAVTTPSATVLVDGDAVAIVARMVGTVGVGERCLVMFTPSGGVWVFPGPGGGARGLVAPVATASFDQTGIGAATTLTLSTGGPVMSVVWTAAPARTYRTFGHIEIFGQAGGSAILQVTDATFNEKGRTQVNSGIAVGDVRTLEVTAYETGLTGAQTRILRLSRNLGGGTIVARGLPTAPKLLSVETVG